MTRKTEELQSTQLFLQPRVFPDAIQKVLTRRWNKELAQKQPGGGVQKKEPEVQGRGEEGRAREGREERSLEECQVRVQIQIYHTSRDLS